MIAEAGDSMKCLKFRLRGRTAFFKRAEFNSHTYFTYNNIHKPALLGMLGAIAGYGGYAQQKKDDKYPEYYAVLKDIKVSIVPISENGGVFTKKIQTFNNSVGYASNEEGGNLVVREQWLENPCWDIYIADDNSQGYLNVEKHIMGGRAEFIPYLGKNDHTALIENPCIIDVEPSDSEEIDSIVIDNDFDASECFGDYIFIEYVPVAMDGVYNHAIYKKSVYTDGEYNREHIGSVYKGDGRNLYFY